MKISAEIRYDLTKALRDGNHLFVVGTLCDMIERASGEGKQEMSGPEGGVCVDPDALNYTTANIPQPEFMSLHEAGVLVRKYLAGHLTIDELLKAAERVPARARAQGCVCPPTCEQTCQSSLCPRKPVPGPS